MEVKQEHILVSADNMTNKTCISCKHIDVQHHNQYCTGYWCMHPLVLSVDVISGKKCGVRCGKERDYNGLCKPEGLLYEERETVLEIVERIFGKRP